MALSCSLSSPGTLILCSSLSPTLPLDPPLQWPEETSIQGFRQLLELNLLGMYTLTKVRAGVLATRSGGALDNQILRPTLSQSQRFSVSALILFQKGSFSVEKKCI